MICKCAELREMSGFEAKRYAQEHLEKLIVDLEEWRVLLRCPDTKRLWQMSLPYGEAHGNGPPSYKQISVLEAESRFPEWSGDAEQRIVDSQES